MTIRLNGEARELAGPLSIAALLATLGIEPGRVAVEHNLKVVKRDAYESTTIRDGDEVEVVNFVGGGSYHRALRYGGQADAGNTE